MILEEEINKVINKYRVYDYNPLLIEQWGLYDEVIIPHSIEFYPHLYGLYNDIDSLIKNAPLEICLTSPSRYIREVKKYFLLQDK